MLLITGVYFAAIAALGQGSPYIAIGTVLCFVAVGMVLVKDWFFVAPWRVATVVFCLVVLATQIASNLVAGQGAGTVIIGSTLLNGAFFILLLGVLLSSAKELTTSEEAEREEEKEEEAEQQRPKKKLTYEI